MRELLPQLIQAAAAGRSVCYCRLVETRGSTPQKAGAGMLVFPDGSQAGTLGGGCVEAEVKRKALAALQGSHAEIAKFQLDHDYGWDDGLICGGRMIAMIEPLHAGSDLDYFQRLHARLDAGQGGTEAVVFDAEAAGAPEAATFFFDERDNPLYGRPAPQFDRVDGESKIRVNLKPLSSRPRPYAAAGVGYLPLLPRCRLMIVGGGHVGQAVAGLAAELDFEVWVIDDRAEIVSEARFPRARRRISGPVDQTLPELEITPNTYCLIVTRGHNHDQEALFHLAERGARYVGLIGSRRKIKLIFENLQAEGVAPESLAAVYAPVGLDIGSQTVPEIAVSICAELVAHRNCEGRVPGRPAKVDVAATTTG